MPLGLSSNDRKTYRIYALTGPDHQPRYVGQTADTLANRLADHIRRPGHTAKGEWVRSLLDAGQEPQIIQLEEFSGWRRQAYQRETHWIRHLRSTGNSLLNVP